MSAKMDPPARLLGDGEPPPAIVAGAARPGPAMIVCDHAGVMVPRRLGDLGAPAGLFSTHHALDIGAAGLAAHLADRLDSPLIQQRYSRLVIDCNRAPDAADSIVQAADGAAIPGNVGLSAEAVAARVAEIHAPYHAAIESLVDDRLAQDLRPVLVFVHSFTPRFRGFDRPWRFGVLHDGRSPVSARMLDLLRQADLGPIGDNEPYRLDLTDYSAPRHAIARGLDYLELEVRQDLIAAPGAQAEIGERLAPLVAAALQA